MNGIQATNTLTEYFAFGGGLDLVTPSLMIKPGMLLDGVNYEPSLYGGYRQVDGYERYDGRASPSEASYYLLGCTITGTVATGNTVTGNTSGATATVIKVNASELVLTKATGTFITGESIKVSGVTQAISTSGSVVNGAVTAQLDAVYQVLAAAVYRALIQAVPGSGSILGVWVYQDTVYAFRNNAGGTAAGMWKATSGGWSQIALGYQVPFTAGTAIINDGDTVVGATSGATGVVARSMLQSGAWGSAATGTLIFASITGTFQAAELLKVGGSPKATGNGAQTAITLPAGGRYEFVNYNFRGDTTAYRMYGCNGASKAFEFDGTTFCPITTGMATDTPSHIAVHCLQLFLAFNGSLQNSSPGYPYQWSVIVGAGEIGLGDNITALMPQAGNQGTSSMVALTRSQTYVLYGTSTANFQLTLYSPNTGSVPYTAQQVGNMPIYLDDRGIVKLATTQAYGNFEQSTISRFIQPIIDAIKGGATASSIVRSKNQYRIYLNTGRVIILTSFTNQTQLGTTTPSYSFTQMDYGSTRIVRCIVSGELSTGVEAQFFGSDDGYIYQAEKGFTFDGAAIQRWLRLPFNHSKSPRIRKRYRKLVFEMSSVGYSSLSVNVDYSYGDIDISANQQNMQASANGVGGYWDSINWNQFYWNARAVNAPEISLTGTGTNLSILTYSATLEPSHTLQGVIIHYTPRRLQR